MRVGSICLFVLLNMALFMSCSENEDDALAFYDSSGTVKLAEVNAFVGENWIRATGGDGGYTVLSDNKGIAEVSISNDVIKIRAYQLGESEITITDRAGEQITIPLHVYAKEGTLGIERVYAYVVCEDTDIKTEIEDELKVNFSVSEGGSYLLTFEKWVGGQYEGKLLVYPGASKDKKFEGVFTWNEAVKPNRITFEYNSHKSEYKLLIPGYPEATPAESNLWYDSSDRQLLARDLGPVTMDLGEDLTSQYIVKYPGVTKVLSIVEVTYSRYLF